MLKSVRVPLRFVPDINPTLSTVFGSQLEFWSVPPERCSMSYKVNSPNKSLCVHVLI